MTATEIALKMSGTRLDAIRAAAERLKNLHVRKIIDNVALAVNPMVILHSNPPRQIDAFEVYEEWTYNWLGDEPKPIEVKLADALVSAMAAPKLTVALANKLMRDAHKRGDARAFNAAREALRSL